MTVAAALPNDLSVICRNINRRPRLLLTWSPLSSACFIFAFATSCYRNCEPNIELDMTLNMQSSSLPSSIIQTRSAFQGRCLQAASNRTSQRSSFRVNALFSGKVGTACVACHLRLQLFCTCMLDCARNFVLFMLTCRTHQACIRQLMMCKQRPMRECASRSTRRMYEQSLGRSPYSLTVIHSSSH